MKPKRIIVNDKMQKNYSYDLTEPIGKNFDPDFQPQLAPAEMLELGVFGGVYMRDCINEFPKAWFKNAKFAPSNTNNHLASINYFGKNASQSLAEWKRKGWIFHEDPRGWFQWYCRYHMGRRIPAEDARQIKRWKAIRRHTIQIGNNCRPGDVFCTPWQRQAVLHWAYDSRKM